MSPWGGCPLQGFLFALGCRAGAPPALLMEVFGWDRNPGCSEISASGSLALQGFPFGVAPEAQMDTDIHR